MILVKRLRRNNDEKVMEQILRDQMLEDMRKVVQIPSVSSDKVNVKTKKVTK